MGPTSTEENKKIIQTIEACNYKSTKHKRADPSDRDRKHKKDKKNRRRETTKSLSQDLKNLESPPRNLAQLSTSGRSVIDSIQVGRDATRPNQGPRLEWGPRRGKVWPTNGEEHTRAMGSSTTTQNPTASHSPATEALNNYNNNNNNSNNKVNRKRARKHRQKTTLITRNDQSEDCRTIEKQLSGRTEKESLSKQGTKKGH